jgi:serine protease AprX
MTAKFKYKWIICISWMMCLSSFGPIASTVPNYYFYIQFADKNGTPYSLSNPSAFLSPRAVDRRSHRAPVYDSTDLPINPSYLAQVESLGVHLHCRSKWMNGATALLADSSKMNQVRALPFIKFVKYTGKLDVAMPISKIKKSPQQTQTILYGTADTQIKGVNGKYLHNLGYRGKGIQVAILDAGFTNANINTAFDSLRNRGGILGTKDIANPNGNIFAADNHGANVLSIMAGNVANQYLGTAPDASYWLIHTEYAPTEYLVETDFWVSGIEFADSVGVDVVNSSLGYSTFDDASMNFTYADLNGKVCRASRAATLAGQKGIIICNSAGNDGAKPWKFISVPADASGILTVGAVATDSSSSTFSSFGPTADSRVKPEVCALGTGTGFVNTSGVISSGNGTSYSSPVMAGMMACLLQYETEKNPNCDVQTIIQNVIKSANLYTTPTAQKGYGIPNFQLAMSSFATMAEMKGPDDEMVQVSYLNTDKTIKVELLKFKPVAVAVRIYSMTGSLLMERPLTETITFLQVGHFSSGVYAVCVSGDGKVVSKKLIINT